MMDRRTLLRGGSAIGVDVALDRGISAGVRQVRLVFTEPSAIDSIARIYEVEIYGEE